jgi:hypothetical protein
MGKHKYIENPEKLWDYFTEYVFHELQSPMYKVEYVGRMGEEKSTPLQVPITFEGFECWLADKDIIQDLGDYSSDNEGRYAEYATIITRIRRNCFVQNFKGAAVGLFNPNLIARKLGLVEKASNENKTEFIITDETTKDTIAQTASKSVEDDAAGEKV